MDLLAFWRSWETTALCAFLFLAIGTGFPPFEITFGGADAFGVYCPVQRDATGLECGRWFGDGFWKGPRRARIEDATAPPVSDRPDT